MVKTITIDIINKELAYDHSTHDVLVSIGQYLKSSELKALLNPTFLIQAGIVDHDVLKFYIAPGLKQARFKSQLALRDSWRTTSELTFSPYSRE